MRSLKISCNQRKADSDSLKNVSKFVNSLGKYLYRNIDGAFKFKNSANMFDIWMTLLYAIPSEELQKGQEQDVHEMTINLNITTYQNKIRVNSIEVSPNERTLGCDVYKAERLQDFEEAKEMILNKICKHIHKWYSEYEILF